MSRLISRDPFARTELHAIRDYNVTPRGCSECGEYCRTPTRIMYLNQYVIEHDGGRKEEISGRFCSVSCMRSHHGR